MANKQTAVEWLVNLYYTEYGILLPSEDFAKAKQMEQEQLFEFWSGGINCTEEGGKSFDQYYNETYGNKS